MTLTPEPITKFLISKAFNEVYSYIKKELLSSNNELISTKEDVIDMITDHIINISQWSQNIILPGSSSYKETKDIFIDLDYYDKLKRNAFLNVPGRKKLNINNIFDINDNNLIILGEPGAGKTTILQHICQSILYDNRFYPSKFNFPILISLRDLNKDVSLFNQSVGETIFSRLCHELGIWIDSEKMSEQDFDWIKNKLILRVLNKCNVLLILDAYDEISDFEKRKVILEEIRQLSLSLTTSRFILTSRTADFDYSVMNTNIFEIAPLNQKQIKKYINKRFINPNDSNDLFKQIKDSPFYDTTVRPLTISILCSIYETDGVIPEKPKTIYKLVVELLLKKWDSQRSIKRKSKYAHFEVDRKFEFLTRMAFILTVRFESSSFTRETLEEAYNEMCKDFDLPKSDCEDVINELESHSGLIVKTGFESFNFAHKSIQEYLTADYITRLPTIPASIRLERIPNELAIAVAISSNPSEYFSFLIIERVAKYQINFVFLRVFFKRLFLEKPEFVFNNLIGPTILYISDKIIKERKSTYDSSFMEQTNNLRELAKEKVISDSLLTVSMCYTSSPSSIDDSMNTSILTKKKNLENNIIKYSFPKISDSEHLRSIK